MNLTFEEIQNAFAYCGIEVSMDGFSVLFPIHSDGTGSWADFSETEEELSKKPLLWLISNCEEIQITLFPGKMVRMHFASKLKIDSEGVFMPLKRTKTEKETREMFHQILRENDILAGKINRAFDGVDLENRGQVLAAFYGKLLPELPEAEEREYDLREYRRWPVVLDVCRDFQESAEFDEMEITPPDSESSYGSVDLILATICPRKHTIHSEGVRKLKDAVSKAGTVEFEVFAGGGKNDETVFALHFTS